MTDVWFTYLLRCRDGSLYTGVARNLEERVKKHNRGTGSKYTAGRRPVTLVYDEKHSGQRAALKREAAIKTWPKKKKLLLVKERLTNNAGERP